MMRIWSQYSTQSLSALATSLNILPKDWQAEAEACGLMIDEPIQYPWLDPRVKAFFARNKVRDIGRDAIWKQKGQLQTYLSAAKFDPNDCRERLIVDIGWRGTIQDNISNLCAGKIHGCYIGLDMFINAQSPSTSKSGYLMNKNQPGEQYSIPEYAALEFIFNSEGGSVVGYSNGDVQRQVIDGEEVIVREYVLPIQERLLAVLPDLIEYVRAHGLAASDLRELSRKIVAHYCAAPPEDAARAFIALEHNETFGTGTSDVISDTKEDLRSLTSLSSADMHGELVRHLSKLRWLEAHRTAGPIAEFFSDLDLQGQLSLPLGPASPAYIPRSHLGTESIAIFAPEPIRGSGGHRTIYNMAKRAADAGYIVHVLNESSGGHAAREWQESILAGSDIKLHNHWYAGLSPAAAVATIDYSASYVREFYGAKSKGFYFIQDYEAQFNPVGDVYLRAQRSYAEGMTAITIGRWLSHVMRVQYGVPAASGGLGVDHKEYFCLEEDPGNRNKKIAFLYQPEKFRRAPSLCVDALSIVKRRIPEVEVITYGADSRPNLPFNSTHMGLITDLGEINRIYNESVAGLCLSATNPSRIPFEMMAAGCVPVDLYSYNNLFDYDAGCGLLAYQSANSIAEALCRLIEDDEFRAQRMVNGLASVKNRSLAWETDVAINTIGHVIRGGDLQDLPYPLPSYTDAPVIAEGPLQDRASAFTDWQWRQASLSVGSVARETPADSRSVRQPRVVSDRIIASS